MHYYIVDPQGISQKTFERVQNQLYSSLSELRISGETARVGPLRTITQLIETAESRGAKTIVAVGHDDTLQEVINGVGDKDITVGYVPVAASELAYVFGISDVASACKAIAQRRIQLLDLGFCSNNFFLTTAFIGPNPEKKIGWFGLKDTNSFEVKVNIDGLYTAEFNTTAGLIINSRKQNFTDSKIAVPTDGVLDLLFLPELSGMEFFRNRKNIMDLTWEKIPGCSLIHARRIKFDSPEGLAISLSNGRVIGKAPTIVESLPKKVKMIVGKERLF